MNRPQSILGLEYWQVSTPSDIHAAWPLDYTFYGAVGLGVVFVVADALRGKQTTPEG